MSGHLTEEESQDHHACAGQLPAGSTLQHVYDACGGSPIFDDLLPSATDLETPLQNEWPLPPSADGSSRDTRIHTHGCRVVVADVHEVDGAARQRCLATRAGHRIASLSLADVIDIVRVLGDPGDEATALPRDLGEDPYRVCSDRDFGQPGEREIRSVEPVALRR
jgi:hypothetical protein